MIDQARAQIHSELAAARRSRNLRVALLALSFAVAAALLPTLKGVRAIAAPGLAASVVAGAGVALGLLAAVTPSLRLSDGRVRLVALLMSASPLIAASSLLANPAADFGMKGVKCGLIIAALGSTAVLLTRVILGPHRRRFGGAPTLLALAAAMVGALGIGLHCPISSLAHLGHHVWGAALIIGLISPMIVRNPD